MDEILNYICTQRDNIISGVVATLIWTIIVITYNNTIKKHKIKRRFIELITKDAKSECISRIEELRPSIIYYAKVEITDTLGESNTPSVSFHPIFALNLAKELASKHLFLTKKNGKIIHSLLSLNNEIESCHRLFLEAIQEHNKENPRKFSITTSLDKYINIISLNIDRINNLETPIRKNTDSKSIEIGKNKRAYKHNIPSGLTGGSLAFEWAKDKYRTNPEYD